MRNMCECCVCDCFLRYYFCVQANVQNSTGKCHYSFLLFLQIFAKPKGETKQSERTDVTLIWST